MGKIIFDAVNKVYGDSVDNGVLAVDDLNLEVEDGEFLTLVGPSGSGKSTTLRLLAGLERTTTGNIYIGDDEVTHLTPRERDIAMVFQNYALYPHLSVRENMAFGLKRSTDLSEDRIYQRVDQAAGMMGIEDQLDKKPKQLSGGQKQRVATGRAIVREPAVFLFDEPLSNLDAKLRKTMRTELNRIQQDLGTTTIYVTHDQEEAMTMSDRIAILHQGVLQQVGAPRTVYNEPENLFVAQFIGSPSMNIFDVEFGSIGENRAQLQGHLEYEIDADLAEFVDERSKSDRLLLGARPEHIELTDESDSNAIPVTVELVEPLGRENLLYFSVEGNGAEDREFTTFTDPELRPSPGEEMYIKFDEQNIHLFDNRTEENLSLPYHRSESEAEETVSVSAAEGD